MEGMTRVEHELTEAFRKKCSSADTIVCTKSDTAVMLVASWHTPRNLVFAKFQGPVHVGVGITAKEVAFNGIERLSTLIEDKLADMAIGAKRMGFRLKSGAWERVTTTSF